MPKRRTQSRSAKCPLCGGFLVHPHVACCTESPVSGTLSYVQLDADTYTAHADGVGAVYWIHRSAVWGDQWAAFTEGGRLPVHRPRTMRADAFGAVEEYWAKHDPRNPLAVAGPGHEEVP